MHVSQLIGSDSSGASNQQQAAVCGPMVDLSPASSTNGTLTTSDCTVGTLFPGADDPTFVDEYRITLPSRGKLTVRLKSTDFDSFLVLLSSLQSAPIAINDDGGGGTDSLLSTYLDAGTYIILANSALVSPETGSYI